MFDQAIWNHGPERKEIVAVHFLEDFSFDYKVFRDYLYLIHKMNVGGADRIVQPKAFYFSNANADGEPWSPRLGILYNWHEVSTLQKILLLEQIRPSGLKWTEKLDIAIDICNGLGALHGLGVLHRDVKAGNVLCERDTDGNLRGKINRIWMHQPACQL
jgi:hypothetical protein